MDEHKNKALKQALERRISGGLPSNFNYHMMDRIRLEAVRQHRRRKIISWCWLIFGSLLILGLGLYVLAFYLGVDFKEYIPRKECLPPYTDLILFYWYIAVLVLILLGLDYWMRSHRRKTKEGRS